MSRLLKQVYAQNVYVEFRFESSLRKYDKKPTKKIKCEAYCKHCINHHKRMEESPSRTSKIKLESHNKLRKFYENSLEKRSGNSIISPCKTIKLSKQKPSLSQKQNVNALQMNIYKGLLSQDKKKGTVLQKSQQNNSSSMEDEVFLNQFQHNGDDQPIKDVKIDEDFNKIQLTPSHNVESFIQDEDKIEIEDINVVQPDNVSKSAIKNEAQQPRQYEDQCKMDKGVDLAAKDGMQAYQIEQPPCQFQSIALELKEKQQSQPIVNSEVPEEIIPIQIGQGILLKNELSFSEEPQEIIEKSPAPKMIEESCLGESMMDKCLAFQGGRIYVDTSGQNFYISVRVFNKLRRRYSDIEQLTNVLIHQRPYLESRKEQIKQQLEEYLRTYI